MRCKWCNENDPLTIEYHDKEWGRVNFDDYYLFEMLVLEMFQAGLSWNIVLKKRKDFKLALDNFDFNKIANYNEVKINELLNNKKIIRNRLKIEAMINNAKIFKKIIDEEGSFYNFLKRYSGKNIIYECDKTKSELSDCISKSLMNKGMKFTGTTIIYSYLQAIGIINSHEKECYLYRREI